MLRLRRLPVDVMQKYLYIMLRGLRLLVGLRNECKCGKETVKGVGKRSVCKWCKMCEV